MPVIGRALEQNVTVPWRVIVTDEQIVPPLRPASIDVRPVDVFAALSDEQIAALARALRYELTAGGYRSTGDVTASVVLDALDAVMRRGAR